MGELITTAKDQSIKKALAIELCLRFILNGSGGILLWKTNNLISAMSYFITIEIIHR